MIDPVLPRPIQAKIDFSRINPVMIDISMIDLASPHTMPAMIDMLTIDLATNDHYEMASP